jgi:hypothetical protein
MGRSVDSLERRWCHCPRSSPHSIFFGAFHALAVDDASGGAGLSFRLLAAFDVQCMMDPIQRAVANPPRKIIMQRAARRKVLWNIPPLAAGAQDVHHAVHDRPHVGPPLAAAAFGGRDQRLDTRPFVHRSGRSDILSDRGCTSPGSCPSTTEPPPRIKMGSIKSQVILKNQEAAGRTLRTPRTLTESRCPVLRRPCGASRPFGKGAASRSFSPRPMVERARPRDGGNRGQTAPILPHEPRRLRAPAARAHRASSRRTPIFAESLACRSCRPACCRNPILGISPP